MFSKIHHSAIYNSFPSISISNTQPIHGPTLPLNSEDYQNYVAFLSKSCEQLSLNYHTYYLVKKIFDHCLERLGNEGFQMLTEKEDMYLNFVIHATLKSCQLISEEDFEKHRLELLEHFEATDDESLFIDKIELIIKDAMEVQESPFTCLETYSVNFSSNICTKLQDLLKFMIGHSMAYLIPPQEIFGLCLKWTLDRYQINSPSAHQLVQGLIDLECPGILEKLSQFGQIMEEVMKMNS